MAPKRRTPAGRGWRRAATSLWTLLIIAVSPGLGAAGTGPWSDVAGLTAAGDGAPELVTLRATPEMTWESARDVREGPDRILRGLRRGMRDRAPPGFGRRTPTGLLATAAHVSAIYDSLRGRVNHVLNPTAFGFRIHLDLAASLRYPGNGFVISFRF